MKQTVGVIGGGISGTLVVLNLLKHANKPLDIFWFDANDLFCKGLAYSTTEKSHLLNVRALNMSVFPENADDFINWLHKESTDFTGVDFVPRYLYGQYVLATFNELRLANPHVSIIQVAAEVVAIMPDAKRYKIDAGKNYIADKIVLALGNFLPSHPRSVSASFKNNGNYFQNAFDPSAIPCILESEVVTILGAGLTMIDVVLSLNDYGYRGRIQVISPHGYLPRAHAEEPCKEIIDFLNTGTVYTLQELFKLVKFQIREAVKNNINPQCVIDLMRPHLQTLWFNFSMEDKQQFLRHLRHKWGVARHRAPVTSINILKSLINDNRLTIIKGRIVNIEEENNGFQILYNHSGVNKNIATNTIINCTGPEPDFTKTGSLLVQQMLNTALIQAHNLSYGLKAERTGKLSGSLFTIGPPLKGVLWESTAVPEIRVQAHKIAAEIIFD